MSRVSLVTGGAQRLGREICLALASRGDSVVIHYRGSDKAAARTRDDCLSAGAAAAFILQADLADTVQRRGLVDAVLRLTGELHLLVNNASMFEYDSAHSFEPPCSACSASPRSASHRPTDSAESSTTVGRRRRCSLTARRDAIVKSHVENRHVGS
jgi:NAD(P)-dependent dehydrogenase (short-subunit alcohol dehydrogenase family)